MRLRVLGFFIFCLVVGCTLILQARLTNGQQLYVSAKTLTDYETSIKTETEDMERINELIAETQQKLTEYETLANSGDEELKNRLLEELDYYKLISGNTEVRGEGVIVTVDDGTRELFEGEDPNTVLVHDMDILTIINELNRSGAEVLAVNKQRILNDSSISCSGYTIRINDQFFARPFEIRAIGDSKRMAAALIGPDGYGTLLQEYGVIFKVSIRNELTIPKYTDNQSFKYMTNAKEGE
ncbi:MAG TPA: DUF881 domain-containing protein [Anaerovoracaceae bacterium]|nr:DUF881 domain-containing protein [Anaerovoracaceae bacterium]